MPRGVLLARDWLLALIEVHCAALFMLFVIVIVLAAVAIAIAIVGALGFRSVVAAHAHAHAPAPPVRVEDVEHVERVRVEQVKRRLVLLFLVLVLVDVVHVVEGVPEMLIAVGNAHESVEMCAWVVLVCARDAAASSCGCAGAVARSSPLGRRGGVDGVDGVVGVVVVRGHVDVKNYL